MTSKQQSTIPEPPFWYIVLLAEEFHLSLDKARECAKREMEQERQKADEIVEGKP